MMTIRHLFSFVVFLLCLISVNAGTAISSPIIPTHKQLHEGIDGQTSMDTPAKRMTLRERLITRRLERKARRMAPNSDKLLTLGSFAAAGAALLAIASMILIFTELAILAFVFAPFSILAAIAALVIAKRVERDSLQMPREARSFRSWGRLVLAFWLLIVALAVSV